MEAAPAPPAADCAICSGSVTPGSELPPGRLWLCSHPDTAIHEECARRWVVVGADGKAAARCPLCRAEQRLVSTSVDVVVVRAGREGLVGGHRLRPIPRREIAVGRFDTMRYAGWTVGDVVSKLVPVWRTVTLRSGKRIASSFPLYWVEPKTCLCLRLEVGSMAAGVT